MLEFKFESPTRVSLVEVHQTARAAVDRRAAGAANQPAAMPPRKRRRHDGLYSGKPVPLLWRNKIEQAGATGLTHDRVWRDLPLRRTMKLPRTSRGSVMNSMDDRLGRNAAEYLKAAARLEGPLGALAEAMDEVERVGVQIAHSTYMGQVVADRARWHKLETMTQPLPAFAESLASPEGVRKMLHLLAPSLVFPAATPMQIDFSGEALHRARQHAELHKENLRKMISSELSRIDSIDRSA